MAPAPLRRSWRPGWFVVPLVASLGANVATAVLLTAVAVPAWLRILVAGWPALAFLGGTLLTHGATPSPPRWPLSRTPHLRLPFPCPLKPPSRAPC
jgi:hypothetical protein